VKVEQLSDEDPRKEFRCGYVVERLASIASYQYGMIEK